MASSQLPRILLITRNLPPLVGGMERLNWHIADELSNHADIKIIGPTGSNPLRPQKTELSEVTLKPLWRFLLQSGCKAVSLSRSWKPDFILAGSGLTAPAAIAAARLSNARAGVYLHGLDAALQHPMYRAVWHPAIRRMDVVIANSRPTSDLARAIGVEPSLLHVVHPGVSKRKKPQAAHVLDAFREKHDLGGSRILLSVGRLTTRKGLREFVTQSLPAIVNDAPDVILVVIGDAPSSSLYAESQTRESIQAAAEAAGVGKHLCFLGIVVDAAELASAFECATVHVFPVRSIPGDPEGFGMVAIEAAAHGVPTVAFATGGVVEAVSQGKSGQLVTPGDYSAFSTAVKSYLNAQNSPLTDCLDFASNFYWPEVGRKLIPHCLPTEHDVVNQL